ncbi:MAG TPA: FAD-dependent oxidoreductase, partial [Anaeromyxobacter sp.]
MSVPRFEVAIIGSGFGGSLLASIARRLGLRVALVERGSHPRFAIGESSSPLANVLLEQLSERYGLDRVRPLAKYGTWLASRPELDCGLKRGFTFYAEKEGEKFRRRADRATELLVAASPNDGVADTHWMRSDVDRFLAEEAVRQGAEYFDRTELTVLSREREGWRLEGEREGRAFRCDAGFLVDASGPRGFLAGRLAIPETAFPDLPETSGL